MPWSGGSFTRSDGTITGSTVWQDNRDAGTKIRADRHDVHDQDVADGVNATLTKDGSNTPTAALPMGGFRHTGVGNAQAADEYVAAGQIQGGSLTHVAPGSVAGTGDAITLAPTPAITAYAAGQRFSFVAEGANTTTATVNVSSLGAKALHALGSALVGGEIATGDLIEIVYDGTQFQMVSPTIGGNKANTFNGTQIISDTGGTPILIVRRPEIHGDNQNVAIFRGDGQDDLGTAQTYGEYQVVAKSDANGAANGQLLFRTTWGGTAAARFKINEGLFSPNATGGDQGADTINVSEYYRDGVALGFPRSFFGGLTLSNNGSDTAHDIDIAAGACRGADDDEDIELTSSITKRIDGSWSAGTGNGGLSSSLTLAADTRYYVHAIVVGGSSDVGFDTSATAANLVADHSATAYREIGQIVTDASSNIINNRFVQIIANGQKQYQFQEQATTSGSAFDWGELDEDIREFDVVLEGVSLSGTSDILIRLGDSGGVETTGYTSTSAVIGSGATTATSATTGFNVWASAATHAARGVYTFRNISDGDGRTWIMSGTNVVNTINIALSAGSKTLSGRLTTIRLAPLGGTFDAGSATIFART